MSGRGENEDPPLAFDQRGAAKEEEVPVLGPQSGSRGDERGRGTNSGAGSGSTDGARACHSRSPLSTSAAPAAHVGVGAVGADRHGLCRRRDAEFGVLYASEGTRPGDWNRTPPSHTALARSGFGDDAAAAALSLSPPPPPRAAPGRHPKRSAPPAPVAFAALDGGAENGVDHVCAPADTVRVGAVCVPVAEDARRWAGGLGGLGDITLAAEPRGGGAAAAGSA